MKTSVILTAIAKLVAQIAALESAIAALAEKGQKCGALLAEAFAAEAEIEALEALL
jgi:hypothetical protein